MHENHSLPKDAATFTGGYRQDGTEWTIRLIYKDSLDESLSPVTAVIAIVKIQNKVLAIKNSRGWDIPGGHVEYGETVDDALTRELWEEARLHIASSQPMAYLCTNYEPGRDAYMIVFKVSGELQEPFEPQHEVLERALMDQDTFLMNYAGGSKSLMAQLFSKSLVD